MRKSFFLISSLQIATVILLNGQVPNLPAGSKAAPTNIRSDQCPCILPDLKVFFTVTAPDAGKVQVDLGKLYDMVKNEKGIWTVTIDPQVAGFHYYSLVINGVRVSDPASESFFGTGRMSSAIDIPEEGVDFYTIKNVPHGDIRNRVYFSRTTGKWRSLNIYTHKFHRKDFIAFYDRPYKGTTSFKQSITYFHTGYGMSAFSSVYNKYLVGAYLSIAISPE